MYHIEAQQMANSAYNFRCTAQEHHRLNFKKRNGQIQQTHDVKITSLYVKTMSQCRFDTRCDFILSTELMHKLADTQTQTQTQTQTKFIQHK